MERTELREAFFAETHRDPYTHMVAKLYADAWADGYEQALRDAAQQVDAEAAKQLTDMRLRKTHLDRRNDAIEKATDTRAQAEAQMIVAMAAVGFRLGATSAPQLREP